MVLSLVIQSKAALMVVATAHAYGRLLRLINVNLFIMFIAPFSLFYLYTLQVGHIQLH